MGNSLKKFAIVFLALLMCLSGCKNNGAIVEENALSSDSEAEFSDLSYSSDNIVQSEAPKDLSETVSDKPTSPNGEVLGRIEGSNKTLLTVILRDDHIYDFWFSDGTEESLILSSDVLNGGFRKSNIGGKDFLIVYGQVIGHAYPADIVTIIDEKPEIISAINYETEYSGLFYSPFGEIVCMRGEGVSIGSHNVIPYYWNDEAVDFVPYAVKEISLDELKALDTQNVVEDLNDVVSVYQRDNGLVHVNYNVSDNAASNALATASRTYIYSDSGAEAGLRKYDFDTDAAYGFFLECLQITE